MHRRLHASSCSSSPLLTPQAPRVNRQPSKAASLGPAAAAQRGCHGSKLPAGKPVRRGVGQGHEATRAAQARLVHVTRQSQSLPECHLSFGPRSACQRHFPSPTGRRLGRPGAGQGGSRARAGASSGTGGSPGLCSDRTAGAAAAHSHATTAGGGGAAARADRHGRDRRSPAAAASLRKGVAEEIQAAGAATGAGGQAV